MDIAAIIEQIQAGDRAAYAQLVAHYQAPLFAFLGRMGLSQAHGEEVAQEVLLRAWLHLGQFDARRASFSTWLFTIARNLALNELQRAASRYETGREDPQYEVPCERPQPLTRLLAEEQQRRLLDALRQLPVVDRSVLALAYLDELDLVAVARIEGCRVGAVKTRLHRARQKLKLLLEARDE